MKKTTCLLILAATLSSTAWAACKVPASPRKMPDGKTATLDQMKDARAVVIDFQAKMDAYRVCIQEEHDALLKKNPKADADLKKNYFEELKRKDDAAMDEKTKWVERLTEQQAAYKAAHPK